jgi:hypothetical protein
MGRTSGVANTLFLSTAANERIRINTEKTEFMHGMAFKRTTVGNTNYTVLTTDYLIEYTSLTAGRTVTLPTAVGATGQMYMIKDGAGTAGTNTITIATTSSQTIDGASTATITANYGEAVMYSDGANWKTLSHNNAAMTMSRQDNTTNSTVPNTRTETGWGVFAQGAAANKSETVTFRTAFTSTPIVMISYGGDHTGGTIALGNGGNVEKGPVCIKAYAESTTGFTAHAHTSDGTSWSATANVYYKWTAIGA